MTIVRPRSDAWRLADTVALAAVTILAAALRVVRLSVPRELYFDELFYAQDACIFVEPASVCGIESAFSKEHPLLGKWIIGAGIELLGYDPFGWRIMAALAGVLTVVVLFLLTRRLLRSTLAATLASGLLAIDLLHFVQSRIAMLDVFVTLFGTTAVLFAIYDRARGQRPTPRRSEEPSGRRRVRDRPWLLATGVALGAAVATKWSGTFVFAAVLMLVLAWDADRQRAEAASWWAALRATVRREWPVLAVAFVVLPAVIYVASFVGRLEGSLLAVPWQRGSFWRALVRRHAHMFGFHIDLQGVYPWTSPAWSWPLIKRPVVFLFDDAGGRYREVLSVADPLVWWPALAAVLLAAWRWIRGSGRRGAEAVVLAGAAWTYLPWLLLTRERTFSFLFYMVQVLPFMYLGLAAALTRIARVRIGRAAVAVFVALSVAGFAFFYPVLSFVPLSPDAWERRILFRNCSESVVQEDGSLKPELVVEPPPPGWCWV